MFKSLEYKELDKSGLEAKIKAVLPHLLAGNFRAAGAKKLKGTTFYRAKLDDTNRLLFKIAKLGDESFILLLETIRNHNYERSRFLRGATCCDLAKAEVEWTDDDNPTATQTLRYVNPGQTTFHYLDKPISFDPLQSQLLATRLPLIVVGTAGSGKTAVVLEYLKQLDGRVLYITLSKFLAEAARGYYFDQGFSNERQEVDFFSYTELLETIQIPSGSECDYETFRAWFSRQRSNFNDARKLFEEFRGVLTGTSVDAAYLTREQYQDLGTKQSIFLGSERSEVYDLFQKFFVHMKEKDLFDVNIESFLLLDQVSAEYDFLCVDEIQDFTPVQLAFALKFLKNKFNFLMCGDSNQIVHPNFFSWSRVKSHFFNSEIETGRVIHILKHNYRNSGAVTELANNILKIKQSRFGSIDKESNFLIESDKSLAGSIEFLRDSPAVRKNINEKTRRSTQFAVIVLSDSQKQAAKGIFNTPLVFTVHEAKGLEYQNIILLNIVSSSEREFKEVVEGVSTSDLEATELEFLRAKDKSDKSLEALKFYINALYVALTRSVQSVYWIEASVKHPLFELLGFAAVKESVSLKEQQSSLEEWQREAKRLESHGKKSQAEDIRKNILHQVPVPWKVASVADIEAALPRALDPTLHDKKNQKLVFEMAFVHGWNWILPELVKAKYSFAADKRASELYIRRKYYSDFSQRGLGRLKSLVMKHGVDFENVLGERPLEIAAKLGEYEVAKELVDWGARKDSIGASGLTPFGHLLAGALYSEFFDMTNFLRLSDLLAPASINLKFKNRLIKVDARAPEYVFLNVLLAIAPHVFLNDAKYSVAEGLDARRFAELVVKLPDAIMPPHRKRREYVSSLLSKNEVNRENASKAKSQDSKRIFVRVRAGKYVLNPLLEIESGGTWISVMKLFPYEFALRTSRSPFLKVRWEFVQSQIERVQRGESLADEQARRVREFFLANPEFAARLAARHEAKT